MTDDMLEYHAKNYIHFNVNSRLNITFQQFLANPVDDELSIICLELGISTHEDLGRFDDLYCEVITIGPYTKHISTPIYLIDKDNLSESRFKFLKKAIKAFKKELKIDVSSTCH